MFQVLIQVIQAINIFGQQYPIWSIFLMVWSMLGIAHCHVCRGRNDDLFAVACYTTLEGPAIRLTVLSSVMWYTFIYFFERFIRYIKSIN